MKRKPITPIRNDSDLASLMALKDTEAEKAREYEELERLYLDARSLDERIINQFLSQTIASKYQRTKYWDSIAKMVYNPEQPLTEINGKPLMGSKIKPGERSIVEVYPAFFIKTECLDDGLSGGDHEAVHCYVVHRKKPVIIRFPPIIKVETEDEKKIWDTTLEVMAYAGSVLEIKNRRRKVSEKYKSCSLYKVGRGFLSEMCGYARRSNEIGIWAKNSLDTLKKMNLIILTAE